MTHEDEVRRECERLGINPNEIPPDNCPACGSELEVSKGYVGEGILYCPNPECKKGIVWEDSAEAIRRVL
jgi:NAD-dependent DNA ligase